MTRDEIDTMWQQALHESVKAGEQFTRYHFAALVAAAERESCASALEEMKIVGAGEYGFLERSTIKDCAETIRTRGQS